MYAEVWRVILDRLEHSPEDHRRRFHAARLGPADRPLILGEELILELIVLEQVMAGFPTWTLNWVRYYHPADVAAAVRLAEDHLAAHLGERSEELVAAGPDTAEEDGTRAAPIPGTFAG